jgi:MFS family permease
MIILGITIVITGLPKIHADLGFSTAQLSWVQNAYTLTFGGLLLLGARAGDIIGRRRLFVVGVGLFSFASLPVGLAQTPGLMLVARAIQGVGAAVLAPATLALLQTHFPEGPARTHAIGYYGAMGGTGAAIGLIVGGVLADTLSWRVGFFINLPIGAALALASLCVLHETPRRAGSFDIAGAATSTLGLTGLVYGLVRAAEAGWSDALTLSALQPVWR